MNVGILHRLHTQAKRASQPRRQGSYVFGADSVFRVNVGILLSGAPSLVSRSSLGETEEEPRSKLRGPASPGFAGAPTPSEAWRVNVGILHRLHTQAKRASQPRRQGSYVLGADSVFQVNVGIFLSGAPSLVSRSSLGETEGKPRSKLRGPASPGFA